MNTTRELNVYVDTKAGCEDAGRITLMPGWVLVRADELRALQEKAERPDKLAMCLLSIAESP